MDQLSLEALRCPGCYRMDRQEWQTDPYAGHAWVRRCGYCGHTQRGWQAARTWAFMHKLKIDTARSLDENVATWPEEFKRPLDGLHTIYETDEEEGE